MSATTKKTGIDSLTKAELATFTQWRCRGCQALFGYYRGEDVYIGEDLHSHLRGPGPVVVKCHRCNIDITYYPLSNGRASQGDCKAPNKGRRQARGRRS